MQRTDAFVVRLSFLVLPAAAALAGLSATAAGQHEREVGAATMRQVVTGRVCMPDSSPAAGAVVESSAGGQAITGADGSFTLEVELPLGAESLEVTAVANDGTGSMSLSANARFVPGAPSRTTSVGTLVLTLSSSCHRRWLPTFGEQHGTDDWVGALAVFDDGGGQALYAGGTFATSGSVAANKIAKWDGSSWSALGSGISSCCSSASASNAVQSLVLFDDGGGQALYAGGSFTTAGGVAAKMIAKWDGSSWSALGSGITGGFPPFVRSLTVYDDGGGSALYAGGLFSSAGGLPASNIAKWDGGSWSALGGGMGGGGGSSVSALTVFDDGSGRALYAGGSFSIAGGGLANNIARWDGTRWSALGSGMNNSVSALTVYDDGSGPALYAGGSFTTAGGVAANRVAKWNGSTWSALGSGIDSYVGALTVYDDGSGAALYAGGSFFTAGGVAATRIAKWDGTSWSALGSGMIGAPNSGVGALTVFDDGSGSALYAGGSFRLAGGHGANRIARWDGSTWTSLGSGGAWINDAVASLAVHDDGSGPALYAGGSFTSAGSVAANRIAKWDGTNWSALGSGANNRVRCMTTYDDGSGPALYAGGDFTIASGVPARCIAKWDGTSWSVLGGGMSDSSGFPSVYALTVFDDGSGPALYAGGNFDKAGGGWVINIARWDGTSWSALGGMNNSVYALTVYDDGSGAALYAGGYFTSAGGVSANRIAKWNGSTWSPLGSGIGAPGDALPGVFALTVFDDGSGPVLFAGGSFTGAGGVPANRVASWNGSSWSALGSGFTNNVLALTVHDDGRGPALYAGGEIGKRVAIWDGSSWQRLGNGSFSDATMALSSWDDGDGPALYAGGLFAASPAGDSFLAKWGCRTKPTVRKRRL